MTIVDLQTTVVGTPWRELTFLELETDSGLVGLGEVGMVNKTDTLTCIRELAPLGGPLVAALRAVLPRPGGTASACPGPAQRNRASQLPQDR
jgi:L-alanine-DL-glutamate epimerase-like enolase superfamily enzyme